ncbi:PQQ-dependent sugar dehydrogenase [Pleomorphomonas sp. NRK KF1]|uniref:PQQ-dependent sugar dehydrogenase n=1 Tax=Pleomorphomonas sp. NRK KF1 TaxID=2943000 RepID=UPI0020437C1E|nr:PQQ-dependent sugar dehydrogenase [Pleomorphomonas sp. NRK KF1]MCM5552261.1 PQQ-dependent sugar dehydrogenase [Pleomorphomonas sp. NRK KF1]
MHSTLAKALIAAATTAIVATGTAKAAPENAGPNKATTQLPFQSQTVARFDLPWAIAVIDADRLIVTTKPGRMYLVDHKGGEPVEVSGLPKVAHSGQNGLLDVALAPDFAESRRIYFTYVEPGYGGSSLVLARATLAEPQGEARLDGLEVIWRQMPKGKGGQPGGIIAFAPDGKSLFLTSGDRMRPQTAQDPDLALGKVLHLTLDGKPAPGNPMSDAGGVRAETWTTGHRNPYGLAFASDGRLWLHEMGPKGGDELNLIEPGVNYGWPEVSYGDNYNGTPIPKPPTRPEFQEPALYWTPVIAPAGLAFYEGDLFPAWKGAALIGGLKTQTLSRVTIKGDAAHEDERFAMEGRIRDVAVAPDGAVWVIEDASPGRLLRLSPR